jgi:hypothetical protein
MRPHRRGPRPRHVVLGGILGASLVPVALGGGGGATTLRVSVDSAGTQANGDCDSSSISGNGRIVVFRSFASNLVPGDTNGTADVFVHDVKTGATTCVSVDSAGAEANSFSIGPSISTNGRFVAFRSLATNLVPGDTNGALDVFVHDVKTGATSRVSVDSAGGQANGDSLNPSISGNGRFVAFASIATNLVPADTNGVLDVFVHDVKTGTTTRVSVDSAGAQADSSSFEPSISGNGRFVAFRSEAANLVPGDTNDALDVFVHDVKAGTTTRVSVESTGRQANGDSADPSISGNGRFVAFESLATNLVPGDTNGGIDVFVHDVRTGSTTRVSVDSGGEEADSDNANPSVSGNGRFVAFDSFATNLVPGDTNDADDAFVHDVKVGATARVSVDSAGAQANAGSLTPSISGNGRFVAFLSLAGNLVPGDTNGTADIYLRRP